MSILRSLKGAVARKVGLPRKVSEDEFKRWRRETLNPVVRGGKCYVPMLGLESTRHYSDKQNLHHLGRYEWAQRVLAPQRERLGRVLDCACGVGYGTAILSKIADAVDAVDNYKAALHLARIRYDRPNITWHEIDAADLRDRFEAELFDAIVSFQTIECLEDDARFLDDLHRLLKPGGVLLIDTPLRKQRVDKPENPHHRRYYSVDEWLDMLLARFDTVKVFDSLPEIARLERCGMASGGSIAYCAKS